MQTVHLNLLIQGNKVDGDSTKASMDRADTIECHSFFYELSSPREMATGRLTGRRQHSPVTIVKPVDRSTPLLLKALCQNEVVNRADFRFFRPSPGGSGAEEHYYTVLLENGFVSEIREEGHTGPESGQMMERVSFVFRDITWTYEIGGATHKDSWSFE